MLYCGVLEKNNLYIESIVEPSLQIPNSLGDKFFLQKHLVRSQMFFRTGALKNLAMLEFLFNKVAGLQACNFIKKRFQHRCFSVKFAKSLGESFLQYTSGGCFWKYLMNSLFILHMRIMNRVLAWYVLSLQRLFHFIAFLSLLSISFFFSYFFVDFTTCLGMR